MVAYSKRVLPEKLTGELVEVRKYFHRHPELSGQEEKTAAAVVKYLQELSHVEILKNIGGHGVAGIFDGGESGPVLLFRAELDALPITEINRFEHKSAVEDISHKCGHDGHLTVLLGLAKLLDHNPPRKGKVIVLFQPSEENGEGAEKVLADPQFERIRPDYGFAFHNLPGFPTHEIVVKEGAFTAAVKTIIIRLTGKTSHAAEPEKGINPGLAVADILKLTSKLSNNDPMRKDFAVITPVWLKMGEKTYGTSAGFADLRLTIRAWTEKQMETKLVPELLKLIKEVAMAYNLDVAIEWTNIFRTNRNHPEMVAIVRESAKENDFCVRNIQTPFKWGEDFGLFTQRFPGAMFCIGIGEDEPALHNPDYDFNDKIIPTALQMFNSIITKFGL